MEYERITFNLKPIHPKFKIHDVILFEYDTNSLSPIVKDFDCTILCKDEDYDVFDNAKKHLKLYGKKRILQGEIFGAILIKNSSTNNYKWMYAVRIYTFGRENEYGDSMTDIIVFENDIFMK